MQNLSKNDDPKFTRMMIRDGLILLAINMVMGLAIVIALVCSVKYNW